MRTLFYQRILARRFSKLMPGAYETKSPYVSLFNMYNEPTSFSTDWSAFLVMFS